MCGTPSTKPTLSALSSHLLYQLYLSLVLLINFRSVVEFTFWSRRPHVSNLLMIQYGIGRKVTLLIFKMPSVFSLKKNREPWIFPVGTKTILFCFLDFVVLVMSRSSCDFTYYPKTV